MNFLNSLDGNQLLLIAAAVLGVGIYSPKILAKAKDYIPSLGNLLPGKPQSIDSYSLHEIVDYLVQERTKAGDPGGAKLAVAFGRHLYDLVDQEVDK